MAIDDTTTKKAVLSLLRRCLAGYSELQRLSGRSKQIIAHWAKDIPADAREKHLDKLWQRAIQTRKR